MSATTTDELSDTDTYDAPVHPDDSDILSSGDIADVYTPADSAITSANGDTPTIKKQVAIIGYTRSREDVDWDDPDLDRFVLNNLWQFVPDTWTRLYDVHTTESILASGDTKHIEKLQTETDRPVYMMDPPDDWPARRLPKDEILEALPDYFTNSVSWIVAHVLVEWKKAGYRPDECWLGIYGVDMATAGEYAGQRPSVELYIGLALGMGIKVYIPPTSDLCKSLDRYGVNDSSGFALKMRDRSTELDERIRQVEGQLAQLEQQRTQGVAALNQLRGAKEQVSYILGVWMQPEGSRNGADPLADDGGTG